jgi:BirA family biotin operon repressor/biotin-[acetyl-CoA-carboxylase] ligase
MHGLVVAPVQVGELAGRGVDVELRLGRLGAGIGGCCVRHGPQRSARRLGRVDRTSSPAGRWADLARPPLRAAPLRQALVAPGGVWTSLEVVAATGSTNADLASRVRAGQAQPGAVLTTDDQQAGRGRRDRRWVTPPRSAVAVSVFLRPDGVPRALWSWLPLLAGLGVSDALARTAGLDVRLKWPNDVLVAEQKVCGVLAEVVEHPDGSGVVVGVGINVSQTRDELPVPTATSLSLAGSATTDRDTVLRAVLRAVGGRYQAWAAACGDPRASGIGAAYRERCATIGQQVRVELPGPRQDDRNGRSVRGEAEGVDDDGRLLVRPDGAPTQALAAGDVVHVRAATDAGSDQRREVPDEGAPDTA